MKKLLRFNARFVTELFFDNVTFTETWETRDPSKINHGHCFVWAYLASLIFEGVELWDAYYHAFIKYNGKFYDSDRPDGVDNWRDLPTCKEWCDDVDATCYNQEEFKYEWRTQPIRFGFNWYQLHDIVEKAFDNGIQ